MPYKYTAPLLQLHHHPAGLPPLQNPLNLRLQLVQRNLPGQLRQRIQLPLARQQLPDTLPLCNGHRHRINAIDRYAAQNKGQHRRMQISRCDQSTDGDDGIPFGSLERAGQHDIAHAIDHAGP